MVRAFGIIAVVAVSVQAVILLVLHLLPTGYSPCPRSPGRRRSTDQNARSSGWVRRCS